MFNIRSMVLILIVVATLLTSSVSLAQPRQVVTESSQQEVIIPSPKIVELTRQFVDALNNKKLEKVEEFINIEQIARNAAVLMSDDKAEQDIAVKAMLQSKTMISTSLVSALERSNGYVTFRDYVKRGDQIRALVRFDLEDQGFDYLEFVFGDGEQGVQIVDWFPLSSGQLMSVSIGAVSKLLSDPNPGLFAKLLGINKVDRESVEKVREVTKNLRANDFPAAYKAFEQLPDRIKNKRVFITVGINIVVNLNDETLYRDMLNRLARYHADDPSAAFLLLDYYFYQNEFDKALNSVSAIEKRVGEDGMTLLVKANMYLMKDDYNKAITIATKAIELEPELDDPYFSLAQGYVGIKAYKKAVEIYETLREQFGYIFTIEDFEQDANMAEFRKSKVFLDWIKQ